MKEILIRKIEIRNFKATALQVIENVTDGGLVVSGFNGSGKSTIVEAVYFALGGSVESSKVINQTTKAVASVSLTIEHPDGTDTFTRVLTPTLDASGKVTSSTSTYTINGQPEKAFTFNAKVSKLFGTKDWNTLLRPEAIALHKDARPILLSVAGAPEERAFLAKSNPQLANIIGGMSFNEFEIEEKHAIEQLGKKIATELPAKIEELSAMLQQIPEMEDEAPIHQRIAEIRKALKGVDQANAERADQYNKLACEAQNMRIEAQKLRNMAATSVAEANKQANKQADEADTIISEWNRTLSGLRRQADQIKAEMSDARQDQIEKERQLAESVANIRLIADQCREISARVPSADGTCSLCGGVYCAQLQAKGVESAIAANGQELDRTKQKGRNEVARRDKLQAELEVITKKIDSLMSQEHNVESKINTLGPAPKAPERKVVESTEESLHLIAQAQDLETTAEKLIKSNKLEVYQKPADLLDELQSLNEKLTGNSHITQTRKNNDKINARINELREESSILTTKQLQHKQHVIQLKAFYKAYADSVTASVNKLFDGTDYEIRLFETNMSNDKGVAVLQPMKDGNTNLSTAERLIFWKLFVERVLSVHFGVIAPILIDNSENIDSVEKLRSEHQIIASRVERHELTITNIE